MTRGQALVAKKGMVVAHHCLSAQAGLEMLKSGGNAVDAVVCTAFVNSVVRPGMNGLGGFGGCMVIYLADAEKVVAVDYSTVAPAEAHAEMYQPIPDSEIAEDSRMGRFFPVLPGYATRDDANVTGYLAISIPPQPAGLALALEKFGTKSLKEVLAPAIQIAEEGFPLDVLTANVIGRVYPHLKDFPAAMEILAPNGRLPKVGDRLVMKEMAETMSLMAEEGVESFYEGSIADKMVAYIREHGGILSKEDLSSYRARVEEKPSRGEYRGYEIYTPSLHSGGGATILQILHVLEGFDLEQMGKDSPQLIHLMVEAMKLAWKDRLTFMGDPAYMRIPEAEFISKAYADHQRAELRHILEAGFTFPSSKGQVSGLGHTTHMNVMDEQGNMVALTQTDGWGFGSLVTIPGLGFNMNNGMSSFDPRPGRLNSIAPCKRPISRMCPTIVLKDGQPIIALGAGGGRRIMNVLVQMLVDLIDFGMSAEGAIRAPRFHCEQEEPILIEHGEDMEWGFSREVIEALRGMGHVLRFTGDEPNPLYRRVAAPNIITHDPATREKQGAARRIPIIDGAVAGY